MTCEISANEPSPYACDLIAHAPKFNFLFVVDVLFSPTFTVWNNTFGQQAAFAVKQATRPQVEFEYEEVNFYNFRSRVPKRTIYPPMRMTFYDDNKNAVHLFYTAYTRAMSPIANIEYGNGSTNVYSYQEASMQYNKQPNVSTYKTRDLARGYSASLSVPVGNAVDIISRIRLYHIFDYGRLMNIYNFFNPKILQFTPSELTMMQSGDGAEFEFEFGYDGMFIDAGYSIQQGGDGVSIAEASGLSGTTRFAIRPTFDTSSSGKSNSQQGLAPVAQDQK